MLLIDVAAESIQKRTIRIIDPGLCYDAACDKHQLDKLSVLRENLSRNFFTAIKSTLHKLHYLLPEPKISKGMLHVQCTSIIPLQVNKHGVQTSTQMAKPLLICVAKCYKQTRLFQ